MLMQGRDARSKVPDSRFNVDAYHHSFQKRKGSLAWKSSLGDYILITENVRPYLDGVSLACIKEPDKCDYCRPLADQGVELDVSACGLNFRYVLPPLPAPTPTPDVLIVGVGQALIQLCKLYDADIFCTVSNEVKKQAVVELGVRPDDVFKSRDSRSKTGLNARFVEVAIRDIVTNNRLDMKPFLDNATFSAFNLEMMMGTCRCLVACGN
ncbi:polyketide synthase [Ophiocordyceps camponoti-floridani]|uniref:Polyketide synthase n=1 Tax=Ophiocordyceps camponoti-floridani TaxID=2030778 RepID=A0A8H4Q589_9HYPO|nr:polyketide synthase [Ophiocordyceps camponoti-floridani]